MLPKTSIYNFIMYVAQDVMIVISLTTCSNMFISQIDHEAACCQYEVNYGYTDCLRTADRHAFLKFMIKQLSEAEGYTATFMPVPCDKLICGESLTKKHDILPVTNDIQ